MVKNVPEVFEIPPEEWAEMEHAHNWAWHPLVPVIRPVDDPEALAKWEASVVPQNRKRVRDFLFSEFGDICPICETAIPQDREQGWADSAEVDHLIPTANGGPDTWGNVRLAHRHCNQRRNDLPLGELEPAMMRESAC